MRDRDGLPDADYVGSVVASDALARGVSMSDVAVVVNLGMPPSCIWYAQRAGRRCGLQKVANLVMVNLPETTEMGVIDDLEQFCGVQMMHVSGEGVVLHCTFASVHPIA